MATLYRHRPSSSRVVTFVPRSSEQVARARIKALRNLALLTAATLAVAALCHIGWRMTEPKGDAPLNGGARGTDG
jgi:hypothetical protein